MEHQHAERYLEKITQINVYIDDLKLRPIVIMVAEKKEHVSAPP